MRRLPLFFLSLLLPFLLMTVQETAADQLVQEEFESVPLPEQTAVEGRTGLGWTQQLAGGNLV